MVFFNFQDTGVRIRIKNKIFANVISNVSKTVVKNFSYFGYFG